MAVFLGMRPLGWTTMSRGGLARLTLPEVAAEPAFARGHNHSAEAAQTQPYAPAASESTPAAQPRPAAPPASEPPDDPADPRPPQTSPVLASAANNAPERPARELDWDGAQADLLAWEIPPDLVESLRPHWPFRGPLHARIEALSPGLRGAWLSAGRRAGVRVGDAWWLRVAGQPIARFDVCLVEENLCYASIVALVSNPQINRGDRVAAWPAPGQQRHSGARSAVSHVEGSGATLRVWIAAPPLAAVPPEPQVEFYRDGRLIALGLVDQQDERFWHARLIVDSAALRAALAALPTPHAGHGLAPEPPRIGDDVLIRTTRDSAQRRYAARVFEAARGGFLINAGDSDGLEYGLTGTVWRGRTQLGRVTVQRVQRVYALVEPDDDARAAGMAIGDEVRFGPPPPGALPAGIILHVTDETLFTSDQRLAAAVPLNTPLAIRADGVTIGVAVLLAARDGLAVGFALAETLTRPLAPGQELLFELTDPPPVTSEATARP